MKRVKRILSLILIVAIVVPLVLTVGTNSSADGNISTGTVVSTSEGWATNWTAYTNNNAVFGVYASGQTGNGCTPGSIKLSDTYYTYNGAGENSNFSAGIGNYTNTESILGTTFNFSVLDYGEQSIISFAFSGSKVGVKSYPESYFASPHNYLGYFKQVYFNSSDGLGINLRLNKDGTVQTISGWINALGSYWLLDSYQGNNAMLNIGNDKTNTIEFTTDYHLKINGTVYDTFNCYQNGSSSPNGTWKTFSGLFHDYCEVYQWSPAAKYLAFGMYSTGSNRCQARLNSVKNSPAINYDKKFQIIYNTDGGDAIATKKLRFGESYSLPTPTKTGYTFKHWSITTNGGTTMIKNAGDTGTYDTYGDWTATAVWEQIVTPEARIGTTEYNSLSDALNAATDGQTVTVLKDVETSSILYITSKDITVDLNGFCVYNHTNDEVFIPQAGARVTFTGNGTVYSENSRDDGRTGKAINPDASEVIIENGTYYAVNTSTTNATNAVNYVIQARNSSTITINGGTFYGKRSSSGGKFRPVIYSDNSTISISGGTFHFDDRGTYPYQYTSSDLLKAANGGTISVTAGSFGYFSPSAFIDPSTHEVSPISDGYYTVVPAGQQYDIAVSVSPSSTGTASASSYKAYASDTISLTAIPAEGYKFVNWTSDDVTIINPTSATEATITMPSKNVAITANFTALATYAIKYNKNNSNATGTMSDETKTESVDYTIANCAFTRTGYNFAGWNTKSDGSGTDYAAGATYSANAALTLYAKWVKKTALITLDKNGGTADSTVTATYGNTLPAFTAVTYPGRTLDGYYTQPTGGDKIITAAGAFVASTAYANSNKQWKSELSSLTLYAHWTIKTTTITLGKNGGSANGSATATYDSATLSITKHATYSSKVLVGYYTAATNGDKIINADGTLVANTTYTDENGNWHSELASLTLYAHWASASYTVTYKCGDYSTGADITNTKYGGAAITLLGATFTRSGYVQTGWSTSPDGGQKNYNLEATYSTDANITLYPFWTDIPYVHPDNSPFQINNLKQIDNGYYESNVAKIAPSWYSNAYLRSADINTKSETDTKLLTRAVFIDSEGDSSANGGYITVNDHLGTYPSSAGGATSSAIQFGENSRVLLSNKPTLTFSLPEDMSSYAGTVFDIAFVFTEGMTSKLRSGDVRVINIQNGSYGFNYSFRVDSSGNITKVDFFYREGNDNNKTYFFDNYDPANPVKLQKKNNTLTFNDSGHLIINGVDVVSDSWTANIITATTGTVITTCLNKALGYTSLPMLLAFGAGSSSATGRYSFTINEVNGVPAVNFGKSFTGTINKNGALETVTNISANYGDEFTLPTLTKTGYTFEGYDYSYSKNAETDVTGMYAADDLTHNYLIVGDATFTAQFEACQYTVTFDGNGGIPSFTTKDVTYDQTYGELPTVTPPSGTSKMFIGWYTQAEGGTKITSTSTVAITDSTTFYAHWADCVITLDKGSDGAVDGIAYVAPNEPALSLFTAATPNTNYNIIGYYTTNSQSSGLKVLNADGTYAATNVSGYITNGVWTYTGTTLTLYAVCEINIQGYNIRYYASGKLSSSVKNFSNVDYSFDLTGNGFNGATFKGTATGKTGLYRDGNRYFWTDIATGDSYIFPQIATDPDGNTYYESSLGVGYVASNGTRFYKQNDIGVNSSTGSITGRFKLTQDFDSRTDYKTWVRVDYAQNTFVFGSSSYFTQTVDAVLGCLPNFQRSVYGSPATWNLYPNYYRDSYCTSPDDTYGLFDYDGSNKFYSVHTSWDLGVRYTDGRNRYVYTFIPNLYDNDATLGEYCLLPSDIANKVGWARPNEVIAYWFIDLDGDGEWKDIDGDGVYDKADGDEPKYETGYEFSANNYLYSRQVAIKEFSQYLEPGQNKAPVTLTAHWEEADAFTLTLDGSGYDSGNTKITYKDAVTNNNKTVSLSSNNPRTVYCKKNSTISIALVTSASGELSYISADDQNTHTNIAGNSRYLLVTSQMTEASKDIPVTCPDGTLIQNSLKNKTVLINNKRYTVNSNTTSTITLKSTVMLDQYTFIYPDTTGNGRIISDGGSYTLLKSTSTNRKYTYEFTITSDCGLTATFSTERPATTETQPSTSPVLDRNNKLLQNSSDTNLLYPDTSGLSRIRSTLSTVIPYYYEYTGNSDCTVTVNNSDIMQSKSCKYDTNCTVATSSVKNSQNFVCWKINGFVVSFNSVYTFKVTGNVTIDAVYTSTSTVAASIAITSNGTEGSDKYAILSRRNAKSGVTCIESGFLVHKNAKNATVYGDTEMQAELDNIDVDTGRYTSYKVISTDTNREGEFKLMLPKSSLTTGESYSVIAYYTYKDSSSIIHTAYSNSVTVSG